MYKRSHSIHFVGIGGVGMAGIAEVLINLGYNVSGSDLKSSPLTNHLVSLGARIFYGHSSKNIPELTDVIVLSSAISTENEEYVEAKRRQIVMIPRAEMLAELMRMKYGIAVAGSHGKTSTTSMTSKILQDLGFDPTVIVGGRVLTQISGALLGTGQYLLAEADESDGSFCLLKPAIAVVTNIDSEHMSFYSSFGALEDAFLKFMNSVPFYGLVALCGDDPVLSKLALKLNRRFTTFGLNPNNEISAKNVKIENWESTFDLVINGQDYGQVTLPIPGTHMVSNSLGAIAVGLELGCSPSEMINSISTFPGVSRRTELIGSFNSEDINPSSILLIDDYGHHPAEIRATLTAIREGIVSGQKENSRLILVFQPHRYTRTKELFAEFLTSFDQADIIYLTDIYSAGEEPIEGINSKLLAETIRHPCCNYIPDLESVPDILKDVMKAGDVIVTMGAGSVGKFSHTLFNTLKNQTRELGQIHH
jgi:UDP-N-acetylmuramate--alanine ligase